MGKRPLGPVTDIAKIVAESKKYMKINENAKLLAWVRGFLTY
jgi:hypothetical protein